MQTMRAVLVVFQIFRGNGVLFDAYSGLDVVLSMPVACTVSWLGAMVHSCSSAGGFPSSTMTRVRLSYYIPII